MSAAYVKEKSAGNGVTLKHYLVSSGLTEIIEGTRIYKNFANVFASEYWFDAYDLPFPKRVITDTGKTQYLFRINKGIEDLGESINSHMAEDARPDPVFQHDLFRRRRHRRAEHGFAEKERRPRDCVIRPARSGRLDEGESERAIKNALSLFNAGRCDFYAAADYRKNSDLFKRTCLLLDRMIADIRVQEEKAGWGEGVLLPSISCATPQKSAHCHPRPRVIRVVGADDFLMPRRSHATVAELAHGHPRPRA